ncbi:Rec102p KNAG_0A06650 [Huiozyma naganishii CBS 8797]|uniref:Uncharacterized protein n=1 Tax=Huiozyma naganishii (strain ATCC MYA-139 / BCRC 22969 / CBS 8797 / KCTC 17520 / NBRC 10181 / NCYC 3082 / Yp74L-3) TaxID=1071383 RepID=J7RU37_HUIN7|nr:hypothetical protein KNAG_0A06650 [Kazachstania naganishii CBS 8797]CCK68322.1 hypothetical protein KNAG_0A06650 [Kazachstania naganishii CBS 8797]
MGVQHEVQFETVYMKTKLTSLDQEYFVISKWKSCVQLSTKPEPNTLILPPRSPNCLKKNPNLLQISFHFHGIAAKCELNIFELFKRSVVFWEEILQFACSVSHQEKTGSIELLLTCKLWPSKKIDNLLEAPLSYDSHNLETLQIGYLEKLSTEVEFLKDANLIFPEAELIEQFNEYLGSLIISQLEFRYPLVFSSLVRRRLSLQERFLPSVSYSLTDSSKLLPHLVQMISKDRTATTVYQLLKNTKCKLSFDIMRKGTD